jgi:hypothetical protein
MAIACHARPDPAIPNQKPARIKNPPESKTRPNQKPARIKNAPESKTRPLGPGLKSSIAKIAKIAQYLATSGGGGGGGAPNL